MGKFVQLADSEISTEMYFRMEVSKCSAKQLQQLKFTRSKAEWWKADNSSHSDTQKQPL